MALVTTSRRSTPLVRKIAKDLAFATESAYLPRGKSGIRDIKYISSHYFVISELHNSRIRIQLFSPDALLLDLVAAAIQSGTRDWPLFRGIRTSNESYAKAIHKACSCETLIFESELDAISYDGQQKRYHTFIIEQYDDGK
jgi:hypothetical protein